MTYPQQQADPFTKKPKSPIPPLNGRPAYGRECLFCNEQIIIRYETTGINTKGNPSYRYLARSAKTNEVHNCIRSPNQTTNRH